MPGDTLHSLSERDWLVAARNEIQVLLLKILRQMEQVNPSTPSTRVSELQLALGAAFSLWRAVFLVPPQDVERSLQGTSAKAREFLERVVDTNAIAFQDDYRNREWTSGYYLNNARYRLGELFGTRIESHTVANGIAKNIWNQYFEMLSTGLASGFQSAAT